MRYFLTAFIIAIVIWVNYFIQTNYIEGLVNPKTSPNVDLPLTTTYSCQNFCGPTARCSITGQQCFTDIDCPGCQPLQTAYISGDNNAGKLTVGVTPTYSSLTTDIGTQAKMVTPNKPPMADFGVNVWRSPFDKSKNEFDKTFKIPNLPNMPKYDVRYTLTGEFIDEGPIPSNAYLE
jgi:hypothetical protein